MRENKGEVTRSKGKCETSVNNSKYFIWLVSEMGEEEKLFKNQLNYWGENQAFKLSSIYSSTSVDGRGFKTLSKAGTGGLTFLLILNIFLMSEVLSAYVLLPLWSLT